MWLTVKRGLIGLLLTWLVVAFALGLLSPGASAQFALHHALSAGAFLGFSVFLAWTRQR